MVDMLTIKGHDYSPIVVRDSYDRRSVQFRNNIIEAFKNLDMTEDDVDIVLEPAMKKLPASVTFYYEERMLYFSCGKLPKYVENLYICFKVIEYEIALLLSKGQTLEEFLAKFSEEEDVEAARKEARETLGLGHDVKDMELINKAYKDLAKEHHPDKPQGDAEKFKKINRAHKILQRELM